MSNVDFAFSEPIDLTNCDREPIHIPGQIQPYGVLLALQEPELTILQASQNIGLWCNQTAEALLGQPLGVLLPAGQLAKIQTCLQQENLNACNPVSLRLPPVERPADSPTGGRVCNGMLHRSQGVLVLELEPRLDPDGLEPPLAAPSESEVDPESEVEDDLEHSSFLGCYSRLRQAIAHLRDAASVDQLTQIMVREVRRMTGFDRVMVYRFAADYSGVVVSEDKREDLESYLELHYPASDIPVQARKLYYENWLRLIPDVNYQPAPLVPVDNPLTGQPLDLSASGLRSVSPLHIQYLQNMGVAASMSISLIAEKRLWGLIACHHSQPKYVDYQTRSACEFLGQIASVELVHQQDQATKGYRSQVKAIQDQFRQAFTHEPDFIEHVLRQNQVQLLDLVRSQGAAMILGKQLTLVGQTPSSAEIQALMLWLLSRTRQDVFSTDSLPQLYPVAKTFKAVASGLLAISIFLNQKTYHILWFRPEQIQTVNWAGNPNKPVSMTIEGEQQLSPRRSFELWKETVQEKSLPWELLELEAAQEMRNTLMLAALEFSQAALEQAAERAMIANQAKSQFLAKMSHELRTPLNAILGFTQIMSRDRSLLPEYQEHLNIIGRSGEHLLDLINDVLEMSKIEAGQLMLHDTCFDLHRLTYSIQDLFLLKATDKRLQLKVEQHSATPHYVYGDEGKLRQILINLVANAIKFTSTGYVTLRVQPESSFTGQTAQTAEKPDLVKQTDLPNAPVSMQFEVEDTGPGIAFQEQEAVFEAFMQTEQGRHLQGSGLGLSISRQFARLMGGDVTVQSTPGQGSIFRCCIPLTPVHNVDFLSVPPFQRVIGLAPQQPSYRILVVEDTPENRQLLMKLLEMVGFEVQTAENGLEAISCWQEWQPHLILMDIQMPIMDGHEATRQIRAQEQAAPAQNDGQDEAALRRSLSPTVIIALTANAFQDDRVAALQSGCDDYIAKPFAETTLFEKLEYFLGLRYLYAEETQPESRRSSMPRQQLTPQDLKIMPADWIDDLCLAAQTIDDEKLYQLIDQIPAQNQLLIDTLKSLVEDFRFEIIFELTQS